MPFPRTHTCSRTKFMHAKFPLFRVAALLLLSHLVFGCSPAAPGATLTMPPTNPPPTAAPTNSPTPTPKPAFRVVGYITDWDPAVGKAQIEKLTHINYAFALPKPDGAINFPPNA